jgi:(5-formylfuran-3-yl)methyl phosphate synthase
MTRLLVSVRSGEEAAQALNGGADWIDLKNPAEGALGAVSAQAAQEAVRVVGNRAPVSAACGELIEWSDGVELPAYLVAGVSFAKVGLAGCRAIDWRSRCAAIRQQLARHNCELVAVAYVDHVAASAPSVHEVIELARVDGGYVLFDTYDKSAPPMPEHWTPGELTAVLHSVRAAGLTSVVAGRLSAAEVSRLPLELVDMVGVRGAACDNGRNGTVSAVRVRELRNAINQIDAQPNEVRVFPTRKEFA